MKRSSAILLWISLCWSACGIVFGISGAILFYRLLHSSFMALPDTGAHWTLDSSTIEIGRQIDFANGTAVNVNWGAVGCLIPVLAWLAVWFKDQPALRTRLGRVATGSGALYLVIVIAAAIWTATLPVSN